MSNKNIFILLMLMSIVLLCNNIQAKEKVKVLDAIPLNQVIQKSINNLVYVEGGCYMMGDQGTTVVQDGKKQHLPWTGDKDDKPAHKVCLDTYYISKYETTYELYDSYTKITNQNPLYARAIGYLPWRNASYPVSSASWQDSKNYCKWLSVATGLPFDLPTEAQWEYAARSRGKNVYYATNNGKLDFGVNCPRDDADSPDAAYPVGIYPPNSLGLYDVIGDVYEWVNDWYSPNYYSHSPVHNPQGPETGQCRLSAYTYKTKPGNCRVLRGDAFYDSPQSANVYSRFFMKSDYSGTGFRCVLNTNKSIKEIKKIAQSNTTGV